MPDGPETCIINVTTIVCTRELDGVEFRVDFKYLDHISTFFTLFSVGCFFDDHVAPYSQLITEGFLDIGNFPGNMFFKNHSICLFEHFVHFVGCQFFIHFIVRFSHYFFHCFVISFFVKFNCFYFVCRFKRSR